MDGSLTRPAKLGYEGQRPACTPHCEHGLDEAAAQRASEPCTSLPSHRSGQSPAPALPAP